MLQHLAKYFEYLGLELGRAMSSSWSTLIVSILFIFTQMRQTGVIKLKLYSVPLMSAPVSVLIKINHQGDKL